MPAARERPFSLQSLVSAVGIKAERELCAECLQGEFQ
jgi:hypothetical protein